MFSTNASQVSTAANYIEDVFSTYLYTGNSSTQTITNGIDLSTNGGLVWIKSRSIAGTSNTLFDTVRGATKYLNTNATGAQGTASDTLTAFNSTGFTLGADNVQGFGDVNDSTRTYASWTFRKQAKFFDVVTFTAGSSTDRRIPHSLGSVPGFWIMKALAPSGMNWPCYHRSLGLNAEINLNLSNASASGSNRWGTAPTSTTIGINEQNMTNAGYEYVVYIFAHDAGGFGLTGNDNVISCGSFTTDGSGNATVNLGYEPQWLMIKNSAGSGSWQICDVMRGLTVDASSQLIANSSTSESTGGPLKINSTGFSTIGANTFPSTTYIYIAIRRGPMKVPTSGTSVFQPVTYTGNGSASRVITTGIKTDLIIGGDRGSNGVGVGYTNDRLRGQVNLDAASTAAEAVSPAYPTFDLMDGYTNLATGGAFNATGFSYIRWAFQRAPGFFDEVCYTGTGSARTVNHNLGVVPEFMIVKRRDSINSWLCYQSALGNDRQISLNQSAAVGGSSITLWNNTTPTNAVFSVGTNAGTNASGGTYVNYLFATCPGVSKVGSYTGTGATQTIDCGFTGGARFVLIKRTDSTGDWYVWDTARGMVSGTDRYILLNSLAAEVNTNSVYTTGVGFQIVSTAAGINASGGSYIFWAVA